MLNVNACTTFFINKNGQLIFGRNYDWATGIGMINTNQRSLLKTSLPTDGTVPFTWTSKYGSLTFNQYGKEFPNGGMNEKGLVIELMWLSESEYPKKDKRPSLSVLQWIQYQLDNSSSIEEVIASDKEVRVTTNGAPQHYLIADAQGHSATIEFLDGKMNVHTGSNLPYSVLTNSTYDASIANINNPSQDNSLKRFANACTMLTKIDVTNNESLIPYAFNILNSVAIPHYTKWSIVYDIKNRQVHLKMADAPAEKIIDLNAFDLSCTAKPLAMDMNIQKSGSANKLFTVYSNKKNEQMLKTAFIQSKKEINISEPLQEAIANTAAGLRCGD